MDNSNLITIFSTCSYILNRYLACCKDYSACYKATKYYDYR